MSSLKTKVSYRMLRGLQISLVFSCTIFVQQLLHYPRAGWTGFAVMMIYGGFDNGTALVRCYHRFLGVLMGIMFAYFLWLICHLNFRLLFFIIPMVVYGVYFLGGSAYSIPTIFTVTGSVLGFGYFDTQSSFALTFYLTDYFMCTCIGFSIIVIFETLWFKHYGLMARFLKDTQLEVITQLETLLTLLIHQKMLRPKWFRSCILLSRSLNEMDRLLVNSQFVLQTEKIIGDRFIIFVELAHRIYMDLKALYIATYTKHNNKFFYNHLVHKLDGDLKQLASLIHSEEEAISYKDLYAIS